MKPISKRTALSALLALSLSLLAACGSTPQVNSDPIDDLAALADSDGNLETTIEIKSVGSGNLQVLKRQHQPFSGTYKGKPIQGIQMDIELIAPVVPAAGEAGVSSAIAKGDIARIRGRVRNIRGVPAFVGFMHTSTSKASGVGTEAVAPPTPIILLAQGKTLPTQTQAAVTLSDLLVSSYAIELNGQMAGWLRTSDGKVASYRITSPRDSASGLPTGIVFQAKLSGKVEPTQTPVGTIGTLTGVLTYGQNKTVEVQGILTEMKLTDLD